MATAAATASPPPAMAEYQYDGYYDELGGAYAVEQYDEYGQPVGQYDEYGGQPQDEVNLDHLPGILQMLQSEDEADIDDALALLGALALLSSAP